MDPNATLVEFIDVATGQVTDPKAQNLKAAVLRSIAEDLAEWIERGGFAPNDPRAHLTRP